MSHVSDLLALLDKHAPSAQTAKVGLSPERVRALLSSPEFASPPKPRDRRRPIAPGRTRYGFLKVAVLNLRPEGILVATLNHAECMRAIARRFGIRLCIVRRQGGWHVSHALTPVEVSLTCSQL